MKSHNGVLYTSLMSSLAVIIFMVSGNLIASTEVAEKTEADGILLESQDAEANTGFSRRCGQCHQQQDPVKLVPRQWLDKLKSMGTVEQLSSEQQQELLSFFRHHGRRSTEIVAMSTERKLFERKCSLCHNANRVFLEPWDDQRLREIVGRMRRRAPDWLSRNDSETIIAYLLQGAPGTKKISPKVISGSPAQVFQQRCSACHSLERVYLKLERDREQQPPWKYLVQRMRAKAPDWITEQEADKIVEYLQRQKPVMSLPPLQ